MCYKLVDPVGNTVDQLLAIVAKITIILGTMKDYFIPNLIYTNGDFSKKIQMSRPLCLMILQSIKQYDKYFCLRAQMHLVLRDWMLTKKWPMHWGYLYMLDQQTLDENSRPRGSTVLKVLNHFCQAIINIYSEQYLWRSNKADIARLMEMYDSKGWSGMFGGTDCTHWEWKNCPKTYVGAYQG